MSIFVTMQYCIYQEFVRLKLNLLINYLNIYEEVDFLLDLNFLIGFGRLAQSIRCIK